jgi:hypothetical protein
MSPPDEATMLLPVARAAARVQALDPVRCLQQKNMQLGEIAWHQKGQDLSPTVRQQPIAARHPAGKHKRRARRIALLENVRPSPESLFARA